MQLIWNQKHTYLHLKYTPPLVNNSKSGGFSQTPLESQARTELTITGALHVYMRPIPNVYGFAPKGTLLPYTLSRVREIPTRGWQAGAGTRFGVFPNIKHCLCTWKHPRLARIQALYDDRNEIKADHGRERSGPWTETSQYSQCETYFHLGLSNNMQKKYVVLNGFFTEKNSQQLFFVIGPFC